MRPACAVASTVLNDVAAFIQPGVTTKEVDDFAVSRIKALGAKSAFFGYKKYPCQICISVNEEVVDAPVSDPAGLELAVASEPTPSARAQTSASWWRSFTSPPSHHTTCDASGLPDAPERIVAGRPRCAPRGRGVASR